MRTTIRLDDGLLAQLKVYAARSGKTMTAVIEDAVRDVLSRQDTFTEREFVKLTTASGKGLQPGVDLDDSAALLDLMESDNDPA